MKTIEVNKKFKIKQKIHKLASDNVEKLNKRYIAERLKYDKLKEKQFDKINIRYDKKLEKRLKKIASQYDRSRIDKKNKILGKEIKKKVPTLGKMKKDALTEIQKYSKLSRADEYGMVIQYDTMKKEHWTKCVGGHIYSQRNYPQLAFVLDNIRPISSMGNKRQMENTGDWINNTPLSVFEKNLLLEKAEDKLLKNKIRDHMFYQNIIDYYKKLNENILKTLDTISK